MTSKEAAIQQYFPVVLFVVLYKIVLLFEFVDEIIQTKAIEKFFRVVLFFMLYTVVLNFEFGLNPKVLSFK